MKCKNCDNDIDLGEPFQRKTEFDADGNERVNSSLTLDGYCSECGKELYNDLNHNVRN